MSNNSKYLREMLTGSGEELPEPTSVIGKYLKALATNNTGNLPEPNSVIGKYLQALVSGNSEGLPEVDSVNGEYVKYLVNGGNSEELPEPNSVIGGYLYQLCINGGGDIPDVPAEPLYKIGLLSDVHIQYDSDQDGNGRLDWQDACNWYNELGASAICIAGDLTDYGTTSALSTWKTKRDLYRGDIPVYSCSGNHESYKDTSDMVANPNYARRFLDSDTTVDDYPYFYKVINSDVYVFMPCYIGAKASINNTMFSTESLTWLEGVLEQYRNQRVFLFEHIPPSYNTTGTNFATANDLYGVNGNGAELWGTGKTDRNKFLELMAHYKNVIWFSGHTHIKWEMENEYTGLNYLRWNTDGARLIHLSSTTVPRDIAALTENTYLYAEGQAAIMNVFSDKVVIKGYDLITGQYVTEFNLELDTTPVTIPERVVEPEPVITLTGITATKTTTTYDVGDTVATNDITVTAQYSDGSSATVTGWTASTVDTSSAGTKTLTISYQDKTTTISITVNAAAVEPEPEPTHEDIVVPLSFTAGKIDTAISGTFNQQLTTGSNYYYSQAIENRSGYRYTMNESWRSSSAPAVKICCYDSNDNFLSVTSEYKGADAINGINFTPDANTAYIRIRYYCASTNYTNATNGLKLVQHT